MSEKLDAMFGVDAADYIRQLQTDIERLKARCAEYDAIDLERIAEIERLQDAKGRMRIGLANAQTEIERLRNLQKVTADEADQLRAAFERARDQIERLRASQV